MLRVTCLESTLLPFLLLMKRSCSLPLILSLRYLVEGEGAGAGAGAGEGEGEGEDLSVRHPRHEAPRYGGGRGCSGAQRAAWGCRGCSGAQRAAEGCRGLQRGRRGRAEGAQQGCRGTSLAARLLQPNLDRRAGGRLLAPAVGAVAW